MTYKKQVSSLSQMRVERCLHT